MKAKLLLLTLLGIFILSTTDVIAQDPTNPGDSGVTTEAGADDENRPLDGIVEKTLTTERRVMPYQPIREADIYWERRIWRVIDIREKMNLPFAYPERPFIQILLDAAAEGDLRVFSGDDDKFTYELSPDEVASQVANVDTIVTFDPETYEEEIKIVRNDLDPASIKRFRIKEVWYFNEQTSTLNVRILGIAPLRDVEDEMGNYLGETVMFWIYYPEARETLARETAFNEGNDAAPMTWQDIFEMRYFSSYIYKESNVYDKRLQDYGYQGVDLLLEADKVKQEIFNFEHDLWEY